MSHMQVETTDRILWFCLEGDNGTTMVPCDVESLPARVGLVAEELLPRLRQYYDGLTLDSATVVWGYGVRLSAPGSLDCTDWDVYPTRAEAEDRAEELEEVVD